MLKELERRLRERNPNIIFESIQSCEDIANLKNRIAIKLKSILTANALESFNSKPNLPDAIEELNNILEKESQELVILCDEAEAFLEWHPSIDPMLKELKGDPEGVRWAVLGYAKAVLLNKPDPQAYHVICCFENHFFDSKEAGLARACFEAVHPDNS